MAINVSTAVERYLAADAALDADALAKCFDEDAVVRDEGGEYRGRGAIAAWNEDAHRKYGYTLEPLTAENDGRDTRLRVRLTGPFPGSPVEIDYLFSVRGDQILTLTIG